MPYNLEKLEFKLEKNYWYLETCRKGWKMLFLMFFIIITVSANAFILTIEFPRHFHTVDLPYKIEKKSPVVICMSSIMR